MVFQISKTTGLVAGLSIALSVLGAQAAQAARFFDFTTTFADGTTGIGSFSIDDTSKSSNASIDSINNGYYTYYYDVWEPVSDFTYTHSGQTYTNATTSYTYNEYPDGGYYSDLYGSSSEYFFFQFSENNSNYRIGLTDSEGFSGAAGWIYSVDTGSFNMVTGFTLTERPTEPESVPEPATIAGLAVLGVGFLTTRRKQCKATVPVLEKVCD